MSKWLKIKKQAAYMGYYSISDYAELVKVSRQHVNRLVAQKSSKIDVRYFHEKAFVKYDNGENAVNIYGENLINIFNRFGFISRGRSIRVNNNSVCDIKLLDGESKIIIRFYNDDGEIITLFSDLKTMEIE